MKYILSYVDTQETVTDLPDLFTIDGAIVKFENKNFLVTIEDNKTYLDEIPDWRTLDG